MLASISVLLGEDSRAAHVRNVFVFALYRRTDKGLDEAHAYMPMDVKTRRSTFDETNFSLCIALVREET